MTLTERERRRVFVHRVAHLRTLRERAGRARHRAHRLRQAGHWRSRATAHRLEQHAGRFDAELVHSFNRLLGEDS